MPKDCFHFEIDSDGAHERRREAIICVSEEEGGFSNRTVADDEQFEHVVEVLVGRVFLPPLILTCHLKRTRRNNQMQIRKEIHKKKIIKKVSKETDFQKKICYKGIN